MRNIATSTRSIDFSQIKVTIRMAVASEVRYAQSNKGKVAVSE
jgi:hypothetical protein